MAVGNVDAHVCAPAAGAIAPGQLVAVMGTSTCHVVNGTELHEVPGMCGAVDGGITAGYWGYEAGQSGVGDIFGWFVREQVPAAYSEAAAAAGQSIHEYLTSLAQLQRAGEHGLLALDWQSGNRSVLVDHQLSGLVLGLTLSTKPEDVYRALLEATAFGARLIVENFISAGVDVTEFVVAGGLAKNPLLMQIYADVTGLPLSVAASDTGAGARLGHPCCRGRRRLPGRPGRGRGDGPADHRCLRADSGQRRRLRRALRRVPAAARLLRSRREHGHAHAAERPSRRTGAAVAEQDVLV